MATTNSNERLRGVVQFRLRTVMLSVTLCGAGFALMNAVGPVWSAICFFTLLLIALHVVGNALGTRLREEALADAELENEERPVCRMPPPTLARPAKRLALHTPLGRWIAVVTTIGIVGGGTLGEIFFTGHATQAALVVGTVSSAVLGGFAAFLASSFLRVGFSAIRQAHCDKPAVASPRDAAQS